MKNRDEIEDIYKWDLSKMLDISKIDEYKKEINDLTEKIVSIKGHIMDSSESLYDFYQIYEKLSRKLDQLIIYANQNCDVLTTDTKRQALKMDITKMAENISEKISFITPEMLKTNEDTIKKYIEENPNLEAYKFDLEKMFRNKEHILSEQDEDLLMKAMNAMGTSSEVFYNIDNADINLGTIKDEDGKETELSLAAYSKFLSSKDRRVRKDAFNGMYKYYKSLKNTLAACYKGNIKEDFFNSKVRKFASPLEQSLFADNIKTKVYDNLINKVHNHLNTMYDYLSLKKKILKLDDMHMYDIYVDLIDEDVKMIPLEEGKKMIFSALSPLGDKYLTDLKKAFDERWIDFYPNKGKKSGAYSFGSYDSYPYVLTNYNDTIDAVSTLAHELGHSMHSYYSIQNQDYIDYNYPIFLAEIASTVNEILLNEYLYKNAKNKNEKILYLTEMLERIRTTIYRQTMFAEFEKIMYEKEEKGIPLTEEEFSNTYYELNKLYYGDNVVSDDDIRYEWSRIPHFYTSFYVYKYATGLSCAIKIAYDILNNKENAKENYLEFLSSGGSDYPLNILKKTGIDMETGEVIDEALTVFKEKLEELKSLYD